MARARGLTVRGHSVCSSRRANRKCYLRLSLCLTHSSPRASASRLLSSAKRSRTSEKADPVGARKAFPDVARLVKRLVAQELTLSFVPDTEQRLWPTVMRRKYLRPASLG